ncbi:maleylpyruvate isomerase family mycothiol-dependent enzyme [Streptomyces lancefieldiae]|uniref:Maleylpyruvate isomerase family mycothiol-dependent enzyme n=1 Tax=Streptomyces lancefieldiae TaxID=3075520 RepID=A0ABU3AH74_9ACTN|nr:maleylpyruvate isomerase family mycothiol-dependent enzyme [Streptomyces sp. DSM 40712]MDT0609531.1 maleylpyruvate isomerase family mycothiol-dependent enzyme [Streptomyces sp. DSM 40712]
MTLLAHDRYCDEIARQVGQLRTVLTSGADLSATVPTCPDWTLEDLVRHVGRALRWTELIVRTRAEEEVPLDRVPGSAGPGRQGDATALDAWLAESGAVVVGTLREAGPDARAWSWAGIHNAGFWARRMTHELVVHGADAALAAGRPFEAVAAEVAADAVDEWLEIVRFVQRVLPDAPVRELRAPGGSIHLHATDTAADLAAEWLIELPEDGVTWRRGHEKATVALRGPLTSVLLAFYGRLPLDAPELEVLGARELLELWLEKATFG